MRKLQQRTLDGQEVDWFHSLKWEDVEDAAAMTEVFREAAKHLEDTEGVTMMERKPRTIGGMAKRRSDLPVMATATRKISGKESTPT